jgi:uncharacterized phosphosugar-binding protein
MEPGRETSVFWSQAKALVSRLLEEEAASLEEAAQLIAVRMAAGGQVFVYDTGHMLERELIHRAGGLVAWAPLAFRLTIETSLIHEPASAVSDPGLDQLSGFVGYALDAARITERDVLLLASVTGARPVPVELSLQARARGIPVVAFTSPTFSAAVPARHPAGKRLMDVADVVIRNDCGVGDAAVHVEGVLHPIGPTSGITASVLAWTLVERVTRLLADRGVPPAVIESMNLPGASERNREQAARFRARHG